MHNPRLVLHTATRGAAASLHELDRGPGGGLEDARVALEAQAVVGGVLDGDGGQAGRVWRDGLVEWELDLLEVTGPAQEWPINQALARIGLETRGGFDLFDELRLGRHRHTEKWLGPRER